MATIKAIICMESKKQTMGVKEILKEMAMEKVMLVKESLVQVEMVLVTQVKINRNMTIMKTYHLKIERNTGSKTEQSIKDNGEEKLDMVLVYKFGQMVLDMKVIGKIIKLMVQESFGM
jgi:hypothetical protein